MKNLLAGAVVICVSVIALTLWLVSPARMPIPLAIATAAGIVTSTLIGSLLLKEGVDELEQE